MIDWARDPKSSRLVRSKTDLDLEPKLVLELQEMMQERPLSDIFYSPRTSLSSCFTIPDLGPNVTFEVRPRYT